MRAIAELFRPKKVETPIVVDVHALADIAKAKPAHLREAAVSFRANQDRDLFFWLRMKPIDRSKKKGKLASLTLALDKVHQIMESLKDDIPGDKSTAVVTKDIYLHDDRRGIFLSWQQSPLEKVKVLLVKAADDGRKGLFVSNNDRWASDKAIINQHRGSWKAYIEALGKPEEQVSLLELGLWVMQYAK